MGKRTILVVEDDPTLREIELGLLESMGHKCIGACNGRDALRILNFLEPDLIVLDLQMEVMSGPEFLQVKMKDPKIAAIPVLVVSGIAQWTTVTGVAGFLTKPFDSWVLQTKVEQICSNRPGLVRSPVSQEEGKVGQNEKRLSYS